MFLYVCALLSSLLLCGTASHCCPPGYVSSDGQGCQCGSSEQLFHIESCDDNTTRAKLESGYWLGYLNSSSTGGWEEGCQGLILYGGKCPNGFCGDSREGTVLPSIVSKEELNEVVCGPTRQGILCGECREEFGPGVNLFLSACVECSTDNLSRIGWLLWMLLEVVPLTAMLSTFLLFDLNVLDGPLNAYLLYAQFFSASFPVSTKGPVTISRDATSVFMRFVYVLYFGIFNLQFFSFLLPPFCLSATADGLDQLDIIFLKSFSRIVPIVVIITILILQYCTQRGRCVWLRKLWNKMSGRCKFVTKLSPQSSLHGLSAFYTFSYTRFLTYFGVIFGMATVSSPRGPDLNVVFLQGNVLFLHDARHIVYCVFITALFCVIVLPPTFLLLAYPLLPQLQRYLATLEHPLPQQMSKWRIFSIFSKVWIQHFGDLFQSCYKVRYRFFAAFLLVARIPLVLVWNLVHTREQGFALVTVISLFILLGHSLCQPNVRTWINKADSFIYVHLVLVNLLATYIYSFSELPSKLFVVYQVLLFLPALYLTGYVAWLAWRKAKMIYRRFFCKHREHCASCNPDPLRVPLDSEREPAVDYDKADLSRYSELWMSNHHSDQSVYVNIGDQN